MRMYSILFSPDQTAPSFGDSSSRKQPRTNKHRNFGLLKAVLAACLSVVMLGSITGAGFPSGHGSFPPSMNPAQIKASSNRYRHHSGAQLTLSTNSLSFGNVTMNTAMTQPLTLTSSGTSTLTINSASFTGSAFSIVAQNFPVSLDPGQSLTIVVQFDPTTTDSDTEQLTISSNAANNGSAVVTLSGTGSPLPGGPTAPAAHEVDLSWSAPSDSPDPVAGYNIYRSISNGSFALVNTSPDTALSYVDGTVVSGSTYSYQVTSVDSSGVESTPSDMVTVTIP